MNISFEELTYKVTLGNFWKKKDVKDILKRINGEFRGRELSCIVGPSGSGKSTMLNILSGYTAKFTGKICVNGNAANQNIIRLKSSYIMQENKLHEFLTVYETMSFSMKLKIGKRLNNEQQQLKIMQILESLGLTETLNHRILTLSGGEQKRLTIALELIDDPRILFLDEPTTGLDSSSTTQCVQLLKKLALEGRTVICTIHAPSVMVFETFDHIYALADGQCIFQGSSSKLITFLDELDLKCPETFSPSDFLLEIATNDYGLQNPRLTEKIQNGLNNSFRKGPMTMSEENALDLQLPEDFKSIYSTSFFEQFYFLLRRNFVTNYRDKTLSLMRLLINVGVGLCFGTIYFGIGNEASFIFDIQKFIVYSIFHSMFFGFNSQLTTLPLELPMIKREHFNRWYSAEAYYLALNLVEVPISILNNAVFVSITYFMTNQPLELLRFSLLFLISVLVGFTSQGLGLLSGSIANVQLTLIIAACGIFIFTMFSGFFVLMKDTSYGWHWLFYCSYLKHGLDGGFLAIFGFNRNKLDCEADYCHYRWPHKFLETLGVQTNLVTALSVIVFSLFLFRVTAFFVIKYRLKH